MRDEKDYVEIYNSFFKDIVENPDGTLNKDQVMRELSDYDTFMATAGKVYCEITGGMISKINTTADAILGEYRNQLEIFAEDLRTEWLEEMKADTREMKPVVEMYQMINCPFCGVQPEAWRFENIINIGCVNTKCSTGPSLRLIIEGLSSKNDYPIHTVIGMWNKIFWETPSTDWEIAPCGSQR
jgi:hypothetical protein